MKLRDHRAIVKMSADEWGLGKLMSKAVGRATAWYYWLDTLATADEVLVVRDQGTHEVVGFSAFNYTKRSRPTLQHCIYGLLRDLLKKSPLIRDKRGFREYISNYDYRSEQFHDFKSAELVYFMIRRDRRGIGFGKKLFQYTCQRARVRGFKTLIIPTDEICNYGFYAAQDCRLVYVQSVKGLASGQESELTFVYLKDLD